MTEPRASIVVRNWPFHAEEDKADSCVACTHSPLPVVASARGKRPKKLQTKVIRLGKRLYQPRSLENFDRTGMHNRLYLFTHLLKRNDRLLICQTQPTNSEYARIDQVLASKGKSRRIKQQQSLCVHFLRLERLWHYNKSCSTGLRQSALIIVILHQDIVLIVRQWKDLSEHARRVGTIGSFVQ